MEKIICREGDTVYAVVKNIATFELEVVTATVSKVSNGEIVLNHIRTPFEADIHYFPENEWGKSIFYTLKEAEKSLLR